MDMIAVMTYISLLAVVVILTTIGSNASTRGVQNANFFYMKLALWFFPLHYTSWVPTKNFSHLAYVECPPLGAPIIKRLCQSEIHEKWDSGHISAPGPSIKKLRTLSFLQLLSSRKQSVLIFLFVVQEPRYWQFLPLTIAWTLQPVLQKKKRKCPQFFYLWPRSRDMATVSFFMYFPLMQPFDNRGPIELISNKKNITFWTPLTHTQMSSRPARW